MTLKYLEEVQFRASLKTQYFSAEAGCMEDFENTADFSRRFQEVQDCMCDAEHMFDCPDNRDPFMDNSLDSYSDFEFDRFVHQQMQVKQQYCCLDKV